MVRLRGWFRPPQRQYERIAEDDENGGGPAEAGDRVQSHGIVSETPFSWTEYLIFLWLGVAMLWPWYACVLSSITFSMRSKEDSEQTMLMHTLRPKEHVSCCSAVF